MGDNAFSTIFALGLLCCQIDHKPLEWLATVYDPFGRRGRWISMLEDFNFKIVHRAGVRHANVDVLNHNPVDSHLEDEDFGMEV